MAAGRIRARGSGAAQGRGAAPGRARPGRAGTRGLQTVVSGDAGAGPAALQAITATSLPMAAVRMLMSSIVVRRTAHRAWTPLESNQSRRRAPRPAASAQAAGHGAQAGQAGS